MQRIVPLHSRQTVQMYHLLLFNYFVNEMHITRWRALGIEWNLVITRSLGPLKLPYNIRFSFYQGKKPIKTWDQQNYLVTVRPLLSGLPLSGSLYYPDAISPWFFFCVCTIITGKSGISRVFTTKCFHSVKNPPIILRLIAKKESQCTLLQ